MTDQTSAPSTNGEPAQAHSTGFPLARTLMWVGVAGASAALTYLAVRTLLRPGTVAPDETADRIQALIEEANRLIKTLDEKKQS